MAPRPIVMPGRMVAPPPDRSAGFNGRYWKGRRVLLTAREGVVGEGDVGTDENVVLDAQAVPELNAGLHCDTVADDDVVLDEHVRADVAVGADAGVGEDDHELPDFSIRPNTRRLHFRKSVAQRHTRYPVYFTFIFMLKFCVPRILTLAELYKEKVAQMHPGILVLRALPSIQKEWSLQKGGI